MTHYLLSPPQFSSTSQIHLLYLYNSVWNDKKRQNLFIKHSFIHRHAGLFTTKDTEWSEATTMDSVLQSPVTTELTILTVSWGSHERICALSTLRLLLSLSNKLVPPQGGEWDKFLLFVNLFLACFFASSFLCWEFSLVWSEGGKYKEECAGNAKDG